MLQLSINFESDKGFNTDLIIRPKNCPISFLFPQVWVGFEGKDGNPYMVMPELKPYVDDKGKATEKGRSGGICNSLGRLDVGAMNDLRDRVLEEYESAKTQRSKSLASVI